jgi:hypothetical protein
MEAYSSSTPAAFSAFTGAAGAGTPGPPARAEALRGRPPIRGRAFGRAPAGGPSIRTRRAIRYYLSIFAAAPAARTDAPAPQKAPENAVSRARDRHRKSVGASDLPLLPLLQTGIDLIETTSCCCICGFVAPLVPTCPSVRYRHRGSLRAQPPTALPRAARAGDSWGSGGCAAVTSSGSM